MKGYLKIALKAIGWLLAPFAVLFFALFFDFFGKHQEKGNIQEIRAPYLNQSIPQQNNKMILFGDLHVHTTFSYDGYAFGTLATPDDAYKFAKGEAIKHPGGYEMQLTRPMDFYAVTDHSEFLGVVRAAADTSTLFSKIPFSKA